MIFREYRVKVQGKINSYNETRNVKYEGRSIFPLRGNCSYINRHALGQLEAARPEH